MSDREKKVFWAKYDDALKLIYEWVKTGVIGLREFGELIALNESDKNEEDGK